jgi:Fe-S cluster assembly protein SufD
MTRLAAHNQKNVAELSVVEIAPSNGRPWLDTLRAAGMERFKAIGYPTTVQEDWRLTNVAPIARTKFFFAPASAGDDGGQLVLEHAFGDDALAELVFLNGHHAPTLSRLGKLPRGFNVTTLSQSPAADNGLFERHLGGLADINANPFVALNAALMRDAVVVHVSRGVNVEGPIHLLFVSTAGAEPIQSHPRILIIAEDNSELTLVESFVGGSGVHLCNAVTEIYAGDNCRIDHNRLQRGGAEAFAVSTVAGKLGRGSRLISHSATLGGKLTRNDLTIALAGDGADATLNGMVILEKDQHCDNHTLLDHAAPHCPSHELYKHVLAGKSSCVFRGKILVRPGAQKTDSKQTSKSLLLSDDATMNSQPALEIYADDVKCTHGSTTGPVDEEMVFYLRSRGVGLEAARHLLTYAFAADVTRRIKVEPVRRRLEDFLAAQHGLPRDLRITDLGEHDEKAR